MNQSDLYLIEGLGLTNKKKKQIYIISESLGLKLLDPSNMTLKLLVYWSDEEALMDWNEYLEGTCSNGLYFKLIFQGQEYKIEGSAEQLIQLYDYCYGKFIFIKSKIFQQHSIISSNSQYEMYLVTNVKDNKQYIEKRILSSSISQGMEMSNSFYTQSGFNKIPEEVRIIQLLNAQKCPYILKILSICYDVDVKNTKN
ncbi:unnamed protein product [Paramecium sonneborni]|uniref:Uncharacterized protein n=1 Tax=Paramecium sonneborni TaxID=65129 RepID=A0A8S1PPB2_9CILI|nr:unnamed protein product [Paramecium sonneborni]